MHLALNAYFWNQPHTGSGQYIRQLVYQLNRLVSDLDMTLVYPQTAAQPEPTQVPPSVGIKRVPMRPGHVGKVLFEQQGFPRACHEIGATLAHVPYWGAPLRSPVPVVVTVHDLITLLFRDYRRSLSARLYTALVSASARGASHIITDSLASRRDIVEKLGLAEEKVTAVYLAAGPQYQPGDNSLLDIAVLRKYDLPDTYVLYLGGYEWHKNVNTLLLAYTYVGKALGDEYPLVLAGKKPGKVSPLFPDYDEVVERLGIEQYVKWIGYVDEEDKPVVYRNAATFVFPSRYEGFGLPPLEAMASGVPVVVSDSSSLPEVVGDAAFAVEPDDERNLAGSIIATIVQEDLAAELREKGQRQAATFSWEKTALATLQIYVDVIEG